MAKTKSEPRKSKGEPVQQAKKAAAEPKAAEPKAAQPKAAPAEAAPAAKKKAAGQADKAEKKAAPRAAKGAKAAKLEEPAPRDHADPEEDEENASADADGEGHEDGDAAEPDGDGDVVEVVGEIVDEPGLDDVDVAEPRSRRLSGTTPPASDAALSRTDPLQAYLHEVQRHALLTPDEEKSLTQHYVKTQDVRTAARLVTSNLRLVVKLAYEYRRAYKNIMDLIQEGNIGLMQAVKRYDPYRGVKLSSYAAWWIRAYILRFILNNWRLVKLGTTQAQRKLFFNLNKEKAKLSAMGIEPSAAEIARRLSVDEKEVVDMDRRLSSGEASLDAPVGDTDGRAVSRIELMPSLTTAPDSALEAREMGEMVHERLSRFRATLKGKDVTIFDERMVADEPKTLQELGDDFGISRERVRQLEARLTMKLRQYLKEELGDAVGAG